jgi:hypothetical protein
MNDNVQQPNGSPAPDDSPPPRNTVISVDSAALGITEGTVELWATASFARAWFSDAQEEAGVVNDSGARRREIVFAVCFAESYLLEWVRDVVLSRDFAQLNKYFPPGQQTPVIDRWKHVTQNLLGDGKIPAKPDWGKKFWKDFDTLVKLRNGLVHARASRPNSTKLSSEEKPYPKSEELDNLVAGWATTTVGNLVAELHRTTGTTPPSWLNSP